ncbi:SDR family NAD(P)-dependent oxidoreductase [Lyngbya confervoides]|uniref:SDR family oxidoreductase n=1 Tax=Lyngbya confervoides BDU141951 TaxID=1574623 RepID=A0ABD4T4T8_9CYAN|nr:SDR family oxidoreductase [Lyngbya confervoides]MCM1983475.1 SDR family oxidoreductase [Lyngbya confervoides BDU141951]
MATALITGASSGIGAAFAQELSRQGNDLILVARSADKMQAMAETFQQRDGISVQVLGLDLCKPESLDQLEQALQSQGQAIDLLINNAGFGDYGAFGETERQKQLDMIDLNIRALVDLTHRILPQMQARGQGTIINLASIAAFQPMPYLSVYAATKAFVLNFSEALWAEYKEAGIQVLALCPGPTETNFMEVAGFPKRLEGSAQQVTSAEEVVAVCLKALTQDPSNVVTGGWVNQVVVNASRFVPRGWMVKGIKSLFAPGDQAA